MALALEVKVRLENHQEAIDARTVNLSREGLFIRMDPPRPLGTRVRVTLQIDGTGDRFTLEGVVVRTVTGQDDGAEPGVAVFLTTTSPGWTRFCDELAARKTAGEFHDGPTDKMPAGVVEAVRRR
jgi:uncharacterized protein (TIGR02266 family)